MGVWNKYDINLSLAILATLKNSQPFLNIIKS